MPVSEVERAPSRVSELGAHRVDPGIRLEWKAAKEATEYEVYRMEWLATGSPKTKYTRLAATGELMFTDATVELWNEYSYTVVAVNKSGHAKPSEAARIKVFPYAGWVESWHRAPALTDYALTWIPIATEGGDYGLNTTSGVGNDTAIENCSKSGLAFTTIRPAQGTYLGKSLQTISIVFHYNTGGDIWRYSIGANIWQGLFPTTVGAENIHRPRSVYYDKKYIQGCGTETVTFTVDLRSPILDIDTYFNYLNINLVAGDGRDTLATYRGGYRYLDRTPWVAVRSTSPTLGAYLSKGELEVVLDYSVSFRQQIDVRLQHGTIGSRGPVFGHAVTTIEGAGTVRLNVPYDSVCGESVAFLSIESDDPYTSERGNRFSYPTVSDDDYELVVVSSNRARSRFRPAEFMENLWVRSCAGNETATLVPPSGWLVLDPYLGYTPAAVTGPTGLNWWIMPGESAYDSMRYGEHVTYVTAKFSGATITTPVKISVQDLFWQSGPPREPVGGVSYPLVVTIAGPKPFSQAARLFQHTSKNDYWRLDTLLWNDATGGYIGEIDFPSCANLSMVIHKAMYVYEPSHPDSLLLGFSAAITSSNTYRVTVPPDDRSTEPSDPFPYVSYFNVGERDLGFKSIVFKEECGKPFHWKVNAAPPWVRFDSLSGTDQTPVRVAVLPEKAFTNRKAYAVGAVEFSIEEGNQVFAFDVAAEY